MRNFWRMQLHPNEKTKWTRDDVLNLVKGHRVIGMGDGWDNDAGQPLHFKNDMAIGDIE